MDLDSKLSNIDSPKKPEGLMRSKKWRIRGSLGESRVEQIELALEYALDMIDEVCASIRFVQTCLEVRQGEAD